MARVRLLHWNAEESTGIQTALRKAGFQVDYDHAFDSAHLRQCRADPPAAFVIDLSRLPSHGREVAIALRQSPKTKHVPIVFCNGATDKVKLIRDTLPDANYCGGADLIKTLKKVKPVAAPVKPVDMMNRYGSRTVAQKLGVKQGDTVAVIDPPGNVNSLLGNVELVEESDAVTLCFVRSVDGLREDISHVRGLAAKTKLWICWRKKGAAGHSGVTETMVRETGIDLGLVDYKICSIDKIWSALLFAQRKPAR